MILFALLLLAQPLETSTASETLRRETERLSGTGAGMPALAPDCPRSEEFGGSIVERAAFCMMGSTDANGEHPFVSMRTLADRALRDDPKSFRAHFLMGVVQHQGEGNLPKALFHLETAQRAFEELYGKRPSLSHSPWTVYHRTMLELVYVHGEMDHHEEKIRYVEDIKDRIGINYKALEAWPLLKLKKFDQARAIALEAANSDDGWVRAVGLTALCAVESEQRRRQEAYEACTAAAQPIMEGKEGAIELSNAAAAASEVFRFDEAERYYLEATRREIEGSVNPWGRLVRLYLRQGRYAEALSAWRKMRDYRLMRPKYLDQQDQSDADLIGAAVLIIAGRSKDAEPITQRTVHRPDRQGTSSASADQNEAGAAIMDRVVKLDLARQLEEEASASEWSDAIKLRLRAMQLRLEAWAAGRRAAETLADRERLVSSLRPECPGSIELPEWLDADVIHVVGPGVALAAIAEAREEETLPEEQAELIFKALEGEAYLLKGDYDNAYDSASWVVEKLGTSEALLRARSAAVAARAALELGRIEQALQLYQIVLLTDPGVIRRMGFTLPVNLVAAGDSDEAKKAVELLEDSPLFDVENWGFELHVEEGLATLVGGDGAEILRVRIPSAKSKDPEAAARRIAKAVQAELLVPNVDVTQADIRSLDGSLGSGARASERAKSVLDEVLEQGK